MCWLRFVKKMSKVALSEASLYLLDATLVSQETWISLSPRKTSGTWQARRSRKSKNVVLQEDVNLILSCTHFAIPLSDAKIHTIFEGTSEIQQLVIARAISGLRVE